MLWLGFVCKRGTGSNRDIGTGSNCPQTSALPLDYFVYRLTASAYRCKTERSKTFPTGAPPRTPLGSSRVTTLAEDPLVGSSYLTALSASILPPLELATGAFGASV